MRREQNRAGRERNRAAMRVDWGWEEAATIGSNSAWQYPNPFLALIPQPKSMWMCASDRAGASPGRPVGLTQAYHGKM